MPKSTGTTDPSDFINLFDGRIDFSGHLEVERCHFFSTCLKGTTLHWYNNLPPRSINSWSSLKGKFRTRFSSNKKGGKITASIMTIRQRSSEPLHDYLTRFRAEIAEIPNLIEELVINYLAAWDKSRHGLLLEEFLEKNLRTLQATIQIFECRLTLQEAVGSIQHSRSPKALMDRCPRSSGWKEFWGDRSPQLKRRSDARSPRAQERTMNPVRRFESNQDPQKGSGSWSSRQREEREFTKLN